MVKRFRLSFLFLFLISLIILVGCQKPEYTITVNGGTGSGTYVKNTEITITAEVPEGQIFVRWEVDGKEFSTQNPYTFKITKNLVINAVFEDDQNVFTAIFVADGKVVNEVKFRAGDTSIPEPLVPNKPGYVGEWEDYTLSNQNITINAVYRLIEYTATFKADGQVVGEVKFTIETETLEEPEVPVKLGYVGRWEPYTLGTQNITINAIYTLEGYYHVSGDFKFENGKYISDSNNAMIISEEEIMSSGTFTVKMKAPSATDNGIVFGLSDNGKTVFWEQGVSYYFFFISKDGTAYLGKVLDGTWSALQVVPIPNYVINATYEIKVAWDGTKVRGYINDEMLISYVDPNPLRGNKIGLRAQTAGVEYTDIVLSNELPEDPNAPSNYNNVNGAFEEHDGVLISKSGNAFAVHKELTFTSGSIAAYLKANERGDNGIVFGLTDNGLTSYWEQGVSYYFFFISRDGTAYLAKVDNGWKVLKVVAIPNYNVNKTYKVSISWNGEKIWCYVDDVLYITYTDDNPLTGTKVGLRAQVANVEYSDIELTDEIPEEQVAPEGYKVVSGVFEEVEGVLVSNAGNSFAVKEEQLFTSGRYMAFLKANIPSDNGIVFGLTDFNKDEYWETGVSYYFFFINFNGTLILAKVDNGWNTLADNPDLEATYDPTNTYMLTVEWIGNTIKCYVDDVLYIIYEDTNPLGGYKVGVRAQIAGVEFSNITIEEEHTEEPIYEYQIIKGNFDIVNGVATSTENQSLAIIKDVVFANGTFSVNIKASVASDSGIIFGLTDDDQTDYWENKGVKYYFFFVAGWGGAYLAKVDNGWNELKTLPLPGYNVNNTYKVSVVWDGTTIRCYINDALVFIYNDPNPLTGKKVGLRAQTPNVKYSDILINDDLPPAPVAPEEYQITSGAFISQDDKLISASGNSFAVLKDTTFSQGTYSAYLKANLKSDNGIVFGLTDNGLTQYWEQGVSYYFFFINLNGTMILAKVDNGWTTLTYKADLEVGYDPTRTFKIAVEWDGSTINCYVDDVLYITYTDDNPLTGTKVGLRVQQPGVEFTDIEINVPDKD